MRSMRPFVRTISICSLMLVVAIGFSSGILSGSLEAYTFNSPFMTGKVSHFRMADCEFSSQAAEMLGLYEVHPAVRQAAKTETGRIFRNIRLYVLE